MFKKILIVLVLAIAGFAGYVAMQPDDFSISRNATMAAPPAVVFEQVNDFHKWEAWSPWAKLDPNSKVTFEGKESGEGAVMSWVGNNEVGEGKMTIVKSVPAERVDIKLDFVKPMPGTSLTEFTFKPEGDKTVVTWTMSGKNNFVGKAMCLVMNMQKMVGGKFEEGLASMKAVVEAPKKS